MRLGTPVEPLQSNLETADVVETNDSSNADVPRTKQVSFEEKEEVNNSYEVCDRDQLLEVLKAQKVQYKKNPPRLTVGMIGYPNVGKSSTVNVLMQTKKVSISSFYFSFWESLVFVRCLG